jgi:hypothetical protein
MISSPGWVCLTNGAVGPMSTRAWTTWCPGMLRLCCWRSVRLIASGCCAVMTVPPSTSVPEATRNPAITAQCSGRLPEWPEGGSDFLGEQLGFFPGGEVAAPLGLVEVDQVGVDLLGPAARGLEDLAGEHREGDRE